jgi:GT2 family glycosyltransferase
VSDVPELSVVIPSWNTRELLRACLASIERAPKPSTEVIVVDNASHDGSADMVEADFPEVRLRRNDENEGFARGCNQGMDLARGRWILLLNADTEILDDGLERQVRFLEEHPEHGAVAPRLVSPDGSTQRTCMRFPGWWTPLFFATPLERWFPRSREMRRYFMLDWDQESERDVDQPPAAALLLRREVIERVGGFDERLWLFFNDVDLSRRMADAGWRTRYLADARVLHHVGESTKQFGTRVVEWQRNRLWYYEKHMGRLAKLWVKACVSLAWGDWVAGNLWRRLRRREAEPLGPMSRAFRELLRS